MIQHPYPMYYYSDNIQESILIFQKGRFEYSYAKNLPLRPLEKSKIPVDEYNGQEWYLTVWKITNVLPLGERLEKGIAAFPDEIPRRLIRLFSYAGETILDPFMGSGTTNKIAKELGRNSWGYELDVELRDIIERKLHNSDGKADDKVQFMIRYDAQKLRQSVQAKVKKQLSVTRKL